MPRCLAKALTAGLLASGPALAQRAAEITAPRDEFLVALPEGRVLQRTALEVITLDLGPAFGALRIAAALPDPKDGKA